MSGKAAKRLRNESLPRPRDSLLPTLNRIMRGRAFPAGPRIAPAERARLNNLSRNQRKAAR